MRVLLFLLPIFLVSCATYDNIEPAVAPGEQLVLTEDSITVYLMRPESALFSPATNGDYGPPIHIDVYAFNQLFGSIPPNSYMELRLPLDENGTVHLSGKLWDFSNLRLSAQPNTTHYLRLVSEPIAPPRLNFRMLGPVEGPKVLRRSRHRVEPLPLAGNQLISTAAR